MNNNLRNIYSKSGAKKWAYLPQQGLKLRCTSHVKQDVVHGVRLLRCHVQKLAHSLTVPKNTVRAQVPSSACFKNIIRMRSELNASTCRILDVSRTHHIDVQQSVFTVLRSPFVFKKTREQFALKTHVCDLILTQDSKYTPFLLRRLACLTLPCEVQVTVLGM